MKPVHTALIPSHSVTPPRALLDDGSSQRGRQRLTTTMKYMHLSPGVTGTAIILLDHRPIEAAGGDRGETTPPENTNGANTATY